jgi:Protein of unknown function (DUF1064)
MNDYATLYKLAKRVCDLKRNSGDMKSTKGWRNISAKQKGLSPAISEALSKANFVYTEKPTPSAFAGLPVSTGKRRNKHNNVRQWYKEMRFDSKAELRRWQQLEQLVEVGAIHNLQHHPRFKLHVNGSLICTYEADSLYTLVEDGAAVVEDVKGMRTDVYKLKKKLMAACLGIFIQEIKA